MENVSQKRPNADISGYLLPGPHEEPPTYQEQAILALLQGANHQEAAAAAGVTARTLRRWLQDPVFLGMLRRARAAQWTESTSLLQAATREAVETLQRVMRCRDHPSAQVAACRILLDRAIKAVELDDLAGRLAELEA